VLRHSTFRRSVDLLPSRKRHAIAAYLIDLHQGTNRLGSVMAGIGSNKQWRGEHPACDKDRSPGSDDDNATTDYVDYADVHDGFDYDVAADDSDGNSHLHPQERNGRKQGKSCCQGDILVRSRGRNFWHQGIVQTVRWHMFNLNPA
jgi:hypothetical protein